MFTLETFDNINKWQKVNKEFVTEEDAKSYYESIKEEQLLIDSSIKEVYLFDKIKVSIYTTSGLLSCPSKYEGFLLEWGRVDYAQYKKVPYCVFIPKGKRKPIRILKAYNPFILITKGWDNLTPPTWNSTPIEHDGIITSKSKYLSHDEKYITDFNQWFTKQKTEIITDQRYKTQ